MGNDTTIQWTSATWNPIRGCSRVDDDCINCYAEGVAARFSGPGLAYEGLARRSSKGLPLWTGKVRMVPEHFADPLRWQRPRKIFVNSMSDLFHEELSNEQIAAMFGVMAAADRHTMQPLTKRAARMPEWFRWVERAARECNDGRGMTVAAFCFALAQREARRPGARPEDEALLSKSSTVAAALAAPWPLPNVHLGVSAGFQRAADERIPHLLSTPAVVRWVSAEPLIGPIDLNAIDATKAGWRAVNGFPEPTAISAFGKWQETPMRARLQNGIDWVVVGGESGRKARPFDLTWARDILNACKAADVPVFMKQMGAFPMIGRNKLLMEGSARLAPFAEQPESEWPEGTFFGNQSGRPEWNGRQALLKDGHGGDPAEWPADLRVREFPATPEHPTQRAGTQTQGESR